MIELELQTMIAQRIRRTAAQRLSFGHVMGMALYEPQHGYYCRPGEKVGKDGDFYTSVSIGTILAEVLTMAIVKRHRPDEGPLILVEWGAGPGRLAMQLLDTLQARFPEIYGTCRYELVEISPAHRASQVERLSGHADRVVQWTPEEWERSGSKERIILFSNELLDAFPVERIRCQNGIYEQAYVRNSQGHTPPFEWEWAEPETEVLDYLDEHFVNLFEGQIADLSMEALNWYRKMLRKLKHSRMIHIDYGHESAELFASHRMNGSLLCYYRHQANDEPLQRMGEQDITAQVHFTAFQDAAQQAKWNVEPLVTQNEFLLREGVMSLLQDNLTGHPMDDISKKNRAIRQLLVGAGMGDVFKVMEHWQDRG